MRKLPSGRWQCRYRDPAGRERGASFLTRREAQRYAAQVTTQLAVADWVDPDVGRVELASWVRAWQRGRTVRPSTRAAEDSRLATHVLPRWGAWPLQGVTALEVRGWVADLDRAGLAPATTAKCLRLLSTVLQAAVAEGLLRGNPCRGVRVPAGKVRQEQVFLAPAQVDRLLEVLAPRWRPLVTVAYASGCRWGELAGLRRRRVEVEAGRLQVAETLVEISGRFTFGPPKTAKSSRWVRLPTSAAAVLAGHVTGLPDQGGDQLLFTSPGGGPMSRTRFRARVWLPAVAAAGLDPAPRFHDLRHSHVAALIADGSSPRAVMARLGHASIAVTLGTYGHLLPDVDDRLLDRLERRLTARPAGPVDAGDPLTPAETAALAALDADA